MSALTDEQLTTLRLVAHLGNPLLHNDTDTRRGARASSIARAAGWPGTRSAVNRLLILRQRGLVVDVDPFGDGSTRWYTTDDGEGLLEDVGR